jgi:hypothetical protein
MAWEGSTRRATLPRDWHKITKRILRRDPVCTLCWAAPSTEADHVGDRLDHRDESLRGVCGPCHRRRTLGQAVAVRRRMVTDKKRPQEPHPGSF